MINIEDRHIKAAEGLLIDGNRFEDVERIPFIKNLDSCDLLAVPGSGKTTALLAKLYCLSKHLPLEDGSGILVLSHTNAAVNEIEKKLKKEVPELFEYPNFVGTVQSYVNKFLANPACFEKYGEYLSTIDDDVANKLIINQTKGLGFDNALSKYFFFQTFNQSAIVTKKLLNEEYKLADTEAKKVIAKLKSLKVLSKGSLVYSKVKNNKVINSLSVSDEIKGIIKRIAIKAKQITNNEKYKRGILYTLDFLENKFTYQQPLDFKTNSGKFLLELYENNFKNGIARYRDCYSLGYWYLKEFPGIRNLLQKRFKYVFIDEMQDLEKYQIEIIDKIFYSEKSPTVIQRIGDINQAIYNSGNKVKSKADWNVREPLMYLNDSYRLTKEVADIVNYFTLDKQQNEDGEPRFVVNGKRELESAIKPHLILFDHSTKGNLKDKFSELIKKFELEKRKEGSKYGFKIIGWNAKWNDNEDHNDKLRLEDIFKDYKKEHSSLKETYDSLSKYLQYFDKSKTTLSSARKSILNALIHILRIEGKMYSLKIRGKEQNRYYSKKELINHIKEDESKYEIFKHNLFQWSFDLAVKHNYKEVYGSVKGYIGSDFKDWFSFEISQKTNDFLGTDFEELIQEKEIDEEKQPSDINIEIGTVHSVKGQTHCATMYVETSYYTYETEKKNVKEALKKEEHNFNLGNNSDVQGKESFKMMYVGFSRPTHLLCFAVLKDNIKDEIDNYKNAGWAIVDLTESEKS